MLSLTDILCCQLSKKIHLMLMGNRQYQAGHIFLKVIYLQEKHTLKQNLLKSMNPDIWFLGTLN